MLFSAKKLNLRWPYETIHFTRLESLKISNLLLLLEFNNKKKIIKTNTR